MLAPLRLRKKRIRLISNSKGFSSIVGAVFAVLVMMSLISTVFVWSLSQNTLYNNAVTQTRQVDLDRANEKVVGSVNVSRDTGTTNVWVNGTLENDGPLSVSIVTLWVVAANTFGSTYAYKPLSITLKPGYNITTSNKVALGQLAGESLSCWFITARGNSISKNGGTLSTTINNFPTTVVGSLVSQGIGSIAMNFSYFWHYDFATKPADGTLLPSRTKANYTVSQGNYTIFHVVLANYDPEGKNITLDGNSSIYVIGSHSQTVKWGIWGLVNVTNGKIYPSQTNFKANLTLGVQTELYFAGTVSSSSIDSNAVYPLNIMAVGTKGGSDYGQNIPFVSVYLVN